MATKTSRAFHCLFSLAMGALTCCAALAWNGSAFAQHDDDDTIHRDGESDVEVRRRNREIEVGPRPKPYTGVVRTGEDNAPPLNTRTGRRYGYPDAPGIGATRADGIGQGAISSARGGTGGVERGGNFGGVRGTGRSAGYRTEGEYGAHGPGPGPALGHVIDPIDVDWVDVPPDDVRVTRYADPYDRRGDRVVRDRYVDRDRYLDDDYVADRRAGASTNARVRTSDRDRNAVRDRVEFDERRESVRDRDYAVERGPVRRSNDRDRNVARDRRDVDDRFGDADYERRDDRDYREDPRDNLQTSRDSRDYDVIVPERRPAPNTDRRNRLSRDDDYRTSRRLNDGR